MKLKICSCLLSILALTSCAKKNSNAVKDVPPSFEIQSVEGKLDAANTHVVKLPRIEKGEGPGYTIQPPSPADIVRSRKTLSCPPAPDMEAVEKATPDIGVFSFHLSDAEFPGLKMLPLHAACKFTAVLTNKLGSTMTKSYPFRLEFDDPPVLDIVQDEMAEGNFPDDRVNFHFPVEDVIIHNNLNYPIPFLYKPVATGNGWPLYTINGVGMGFLKPPVVFTVNMIYLSEKAINITTDSKTYAKFTVLPGDTVIAHGMIALTALTPTSRDGMVSVSGTPVPPPFQTRASLIGFAVDGYPSAGNVHSLYMPRSFDYDEEDVRSPMLAPVPLAEVNFTRGPMPQWPTIYRFFSFVN